MQDGHVVQLEMLTRRRVLRSASRQTPGSRHAGLRDNITFENATIA
jgi:hypothetical protein